MSADSATAVEQFAFSLSDLKASINVPQREPTLHTVFDKNAKCLDRVSKVTPRWIIRISIRQRQVFQYFVNLVIHRACEFGMWSNANYRVQFQLL